MRPWTGERASLFFAKVDVDANGCWRWLACKNSFGYGQFWFRGKMQLAHRVSYINHVGEIPGGLELDHLCRVRDCVNPGHLEAVTHLENTRRGRAGAHLREKTHCKRGHEFTAENTRVASGNRRVCKTCSNMHIRNYRMRKKNQEGSK